MIYQKFLSKTLRSVSALAVCGALLSSTFSSPTWGMRPEEEKLVTALPEIRNRIFVMCDWGTQQNLSLIAKKFNVLFHGTGKAVLVMPDDKSMNTFRSGYSTKRFYSPYQNMILKECYSPLGIETYTWTWGMENVEISYFGVLPPSLKELHLIDTSIGEVESIRYLSHLTNLTSLHIGASLKSLYNPSNNKYKSIHYPSIGSQDLEYLSGLTNLQKLYLIGCYKLTNEGLSPISSFQKLEQLSLAQCSNITGEGLKYLSHFTNLLELDLSNCRKILPVGLEYLSGLTHIQSLNLGNCEGLYIGGLGGLSNFKNLKYLDLEQWNSLQVTDFDILARLTHMTKLNLSGCLVNSQQVELISGLTNLQWLSLVGSNMDDGGVGHLSQLTNLKTLKIDGDLITSAGLIHLSNFPKLKNLFVSTEQQISPGLQHLSGLINIKKLQINNGGVITSQGLNSLSGLSNIKRLSLVGDRVKGLNALSNLSKLQSLKLVGEINEEEVRYLSQFYNLNILSLQRNTITSKGFAHFSGLTHLQSLELVHCPNITLGGLIPLSQLMNLQSLEVSGKNILSSRDQKRLTDILKKNNPTLEIKFQLLADPFGDGEGGGLNNDDGFNDEEEDFDDEGENFEENLPNEEQN